MCAFVATAIPALAVAVVGLATTACGSESPDRAAVVSDRAAEKTRDDPLVTCVGFSERPKVGGKSRPRACEIQLMREGRSDAILVLRDLRWSAWTDSSARGLGTAKADPEQDFGFPLKIRLSGARNCRDGTRRFQRITTIVDEEVSIRRRRITSCRP